MNKYLQPIVISLLIVISIKPCTTAVVSGKATNDGRPLLLKNRDADALQNKLVYFFDGKFKFIGLVNSDDKDNKEVWCGFNEAGFAIMNSASYNLKMNDTTKLSDKEGIIMRLALQNCATLQDFEKFLNELPKPLGVEANFGVIDANGGAAYYETNNFSFVKYDVNDPSVAPNGYLIRTNYSFAGEENKGYGYIRYQTASQMFESQIKNGKISFEFLINDVPRCLIHSFTKTDLTKNLPEENSDNYVFFRDYIPRHSTSAAIVVQGVKENELPSLTTMWTILGFPLTSVIIPVWLLEDGTMPKILQADETGNAPLCNAALQLKDKVFSPQNDASENYLNLSALMNKENSGVRQKLIPIEEKILAKAKNILSDFRKNRIDNSKAKEFYNWIDNDVYNEIKLKFKLN
ncbi:MAG TPA: carcinine hydrolase/isopenicillin-N N-acyltransferase family protein [Ignavibacteriaceae bacterium]|nr:carcinine hydrolase/isopenicillin-N N-acyltransferase family protein [Ignavibacteriaceae bacterium]